MFFVFLSRTRDKDFGGKNKEKQVSWRNLTWMSPSLCVSTDQKLRYCVILSNMAFNL